MKLKLFLLLGLLLLVFLPQVYGKRDKSKNPNHPGQIEPFPVDDPRYFEYPTQTWIVKNKTSWGHFIEFDFQPIGGRSWSNLADQGGEYTDWNCTWRYRDTLELYNYSIVELERDVEVFPENANQIDIWLGKVEPIGTRKEKYNQTIANLTETVLNPIARAKTNKLTEVFNSLKNVTGFKNKTRFLNETAKFDKYPIKVNLQQQILFSKLPPSTIDIANFENGSFTFNVTKWQHGINFETGFSSSITYSGATDTITVTGYTEGTPCTFLDVWNADQAGAWGQVSKQGTTQFMFDCKLQIGDGSTTTWFADTTKQVVWNAVATGTQEKIIRVMNNATFRLGQLDDLASKQTRSGVTIITHETQWEGHFPYEESGGTVYLYSCHFIATSAVQNIRVTNRIWNVVLAGRFRFKFCENADFHRVTVTHVVFEPFLVSYGTMDDLKAFGVGSSGRAVFYDLKGTVTNLYARGYTYLAMRSGWTTSYLINADVDTWSFLHWLSSRNIYRQYEFDLTTTFDNATAIQNANVTLSYCGQGGGIVGSWLTNSTGQISTQTLTMGFYNQTGGNMLYNYNPYHLSITFDNYQSHAQNFALIEKTKWEISLISETAIIQEYVLPYQLATILIILIVFGGIILIIICRKKH